VNLNNNKQDNKYRSIRVNNKLFQTKVANVPGGAELLIAAGFHYTTQSNSNTTTTTTTNINDINTNIICNHNDNTASNNEELYLIHSMTNEAEYRLAYTITRLQDAL